MKKTVSLVLILVLALTLFCSAASAEEKAEPVVYTIFYTTEDLAGVTDNNGFVSGVGLSEKNAVVLNEDGTYEYIKLTGAITEETDVVAIVHEEEGAEVPAICLLYVYTGKYTQDGDQVTLEIPEECVFNENWGQVAEAGYLNNTSGVASKGDISSNKEGVERDPLDNFGSSVYKFSGHDAAKTITVTEEGTYTYNEVASSDDD